MNQPIPRGSNEPLNVGDRVKIVPEWQDEGDDEFECLVIEAPTDSTRVRIRIIIPGLVFQPTEWIEADHLILINADSQCFPRVRNGL